jgi:MarR family transcriptional regulator, lower aerobic nicotinate degradation pathway regulator
MLSRTKTKPVTRAAAKSSHYVLDEQVGFLLRLAMQRHTSIFMSQMTAKLTQTQFAALAKLLEVGPCSQNHLGRLIYLDAATIKGVVDRLKLRKFITTQSDPGDRRRRAITLTEQGRAATRQAIEIAGNITATTMVPLSAEEQRTIVRLLKKLT